MAVTVEWAAVEAALADFDSRPNWRAYTTAMRRLVEGLRTDPRFDGLAPVVSHLFLVLRRAKASVVIGWDNDRHDYHVSFVGPGFTAENTRRASERDVLDVVLEYLEASGPPATPLAGFAETWEKVEAAYARFDERPNWPAVVAAMRRLAAMLPTDPRFHDLAPIGSHVFLLLRPRSNAPVVVGWDQSLRAYRVAYLAAPFRAAAADGDLEWDGGKVSMPAQMISGEPSGIGGEGDARVASEHDVPDVLLAYLAASEPR